MGDKRTLACFREDVCALPHTAWALALATPVALVKRFVDAMMP